MANTDLKKSVLKYVDNADDRLLKKIIALVEDYQDDALGALKDENQFEILWWHKRILDERLKVYKENPDILLDWNDVKNGI